MTLFCKNLWLDFVHNFVVEDVVEEVEKFDEEQQETFLLCSIKALSTCSDLEQRRAAVLLHQLMVVFRNLYFLLVTDGILSIATIIESWKAKDHYDGVLAELVFDLLNTWKNINKEAAVKSLEDLKLTVEQVFVGGCPIMVADRLLMKHGLVLKDGYIHFACYVCYQTWYFFFR